MSTLRGKFIVCSDLHSRYTNHYNGKHRLMTLYRAEKANGLDIHTCGDFALSSGGLFPANVWSTYYKIFLDEWAAFGGIITAGNHDSGNAFGPGTITDEGTDYTAEEYWKKKTGCDDNLIIQRTYNDGKDIMVSISENAGKAEGYSQSAISSIKELITNNPDKRIFVFMHYPCWKQVDNVTTVYTETTDGTTIEKSFPKNSYATRYGPIYYGKDAWVTPSAYPQPTEFLTWLSNQPNAILISGHTHNDWRLQEEKLTYTVNGTTYVGGEFPNLKFYHVPNGAYMINIPSIRFRTQDAVFSVYDDKVVVQGRAGVYTATGAYVNGEIDEMADNNTWEIRDLGTAYQYTIPLSEEADPEPTVYSISVAATGCTVAGASTITEGKTATLTITASDGYALPEAVTVTGASYTWNKETGALVLSYPTGAVSVTVTAVKEAEPEPIPLFDRFGNQLSLQQLWVWKDGAISHPTILYDAKSKEIG